MLNAIVFAINITAPNLALIGLGVWLKKRGVLSADFTQTASALVFGYALPALLFFSVLKSDVAYSEQLPLITAGFVVTMVLFVLAEIYAYFFVPDKADKGVFVQGVFRSNMAIISLATVQNAYGSAGLSVGAVYVGVITILYNILAVITLSRTSQKGQGVYLQWYDTVKKIAKNPLIIALVVAFLYKTLDLPMLPDFVIKTGGLLSALALPLALICAGATMQVRSMVCLTGVSMQASMGRIVLAPMVALAVGVLFELPPLQMGVLFMMVASPVAAASYVMAKAMGGNEILAANILAFTTVFGMIGMGAGAAALKVLGWV